MSTIDQFKSRIGARGGLARSNRFNILMVPPTGAFNDMQEVRDLAILCESCSLPGRQIQTFEHSYFRQAIKVAESYINEDVSFTFHLPSDFFIKEIFDKWTNLVINRNSFKLNYASEYKRDVGIYQQDIKNKNVYAIKLMNAFPISVQAIELNSSEGETQKVTVTFTYEDFEELIIPQSNIEEKKTLNKGEVLQNTPNLSPPLLKTLFDKFF
jgi:hypothetical protein